jgi:hypothetical protein
MRRGWFNDHPWDIYRVQPTIEELDNNPEWHKWDSFESICYFWHRVNQSALDLHADLGEERVLQMSFETFTDYSSNAWGKLFEFCGVTPEPDAAKQILRVRWNAQHNGDFPPVSQWSEDRHCKLIEIAGNTMTQLGYSYDYHS